MDLAHDIASLREIALSGGMVLRTIVLVIVTTICVTSFTKQEGNLTQVEPEQNLFVGESAKPQNAGELQTIIKTMLAPRTGTIGLEGGFEYGINKRFWLGPKASYNCAQLLEGNQHDWHIGAGGGYDIIDDKWFLLSVLLDAGYGSHRFSFSPTIALFKSIYELGINLSLSVEVIPQAKDEIVGQEIGLSLFTNWRLVSPLMEFALQIQGQDVKAFIVPGIMLLAVPRMELGLAVELPLNDIRESAVMISLLNEFDT